VKGSLIALAILLLIAAAVGANAVYIHHVTDRLLTALEALPAEPPSADTLASEILPAIQSLRQKFEAHVPLLGITVPHSVIDRVTEILKLLETHARTGNLPEYTATLTLLQELAKEIARLERLSVSNIL
jgi:hypothetical protein